MARIMSSSSETTESKVEVSLDEALPIRYGAKAHLPDELVNLCQLSLMTCTCNDERELDLTTSTGDVRIKTYGLTWMPHKT